VQFLHKSPVRWSVLWPEILSVYCRADDGIAIALTHARLGGLFSGCNDWYPAAGVINYGNGGLCGGRNKELYR
jgi:hypothetical protein